VLVALGIWRFTHHARPASEHALEARSVAVLDFENLSGDPTLDWMGRALGELLGSALQRSEDLDVYDAQRLAELMGVPTPAGGARLAALERHGIGRAVTGSVLRSGKRVRIEARVIEVATGRVLHTDTAEGDAGDDLFHLAGGIFHGLETALEIDLLGLETGDAWLRRITTHSVDAYRIYLRGHAAFIGSRWAEAAHEYEQALAIDSTFVAARFELTGCYWNLDDDARLGASLAAARRLRARASAREALQLDLIEAVVSSDNDQLIRVASELRSRYPENRFFTYLLGRGYWESGRYADCVQTLEPLARSRYEWAWTYLLAGRALAKLGREDEARRMFELGLDVTHGNPELAWAYARHLEEVGRLDRARSLLADAERSPALSQTPTFEARIRLEMAKFYENDGLADSARAEYRRALARAPHDSDEARAAMAGLGRLAER
jgi:TolB-like protein/tetratricopeptide (TPR) repeat protein